MDKIIHVVVRFSDSMFSMGDIIAKHNDIVVLQNHVWFGKIGNPIAQLRTDAINKQISKGVATYLYLVKGNRKNFTAYRSKLFLVTREFPKNEKKLIPNYYVEKNIMRYMKTWLKIGKIEQIEMSTMTSLKAVSSVFPITETLARSSSGYFLVHESKSIF